MPAKRRVAALIFPGFELLDLYGPLEMLGMREDDFVLQLVSESQREVKSSAGPSALADRTLSDGSDYDILLIPGGMGTRREITNAELLTWIGDTAERTEIVATVCTGSVLLAATGTDRRASRDDKQERFSMGREHAPGGALAASREMGGGRQVPDVVRSFGGDRHVFVSHFPAARPRCRSRDRPVGRVSLARGLDRRSLRLTQLGFCQRRNQGSALRSLASDRATPRTYGPALGVRSLIDCTH